MKTSVKLFIASIVVFACALGFFAGSLCFGPKGPCSKGMMPPPPPGFEGQMPAGFDGKMPPPPPGMKPGMMPPPDVEGKGPHGPKGPEGFQGRRGHKVSPEHLDSLLQVTAEQKVLIEKQRATMDSAMKVARQQKQDADKQLRDAMESGDAEKLKAAKASVLAAQSLQLDLRVQGYTELSNILTKEQMEKFRAFHKENMDKKHGPKGPKPPQHK